ncbi:MAG TPA: PIN domain-containing protein [Streptosporangiaceae bacterium]|nr:PIN domain-containing protein [Streptosporangiaceae bacterium]
MSDNRSFVDTNILVYAHDETAGEKRDRARSLLAELWESGDGCLSVQVLQEFFVTVTRKVPKPLDAVSAAAIIADLSHWRVHSPGSDDVLNAIDSHRRHDISFWDAMIICSAASLGCGTLFSEDLNPEQRYDGVRVRNPFLAR